MKILKTLGWAIVTMGLLIPLYRYGHLQFQRPSQTPLTQPLFSGITYYREIYHHPQPYVVHIAKIDLANPKLKVMTTPGTVANDGNEFNAETTSAFLDRFQLQFAVNAGYFYHFEEKTPWDYAPYSGERINVLGQSITNGQVHSFGQSNWPVLCFDASHRGQIVESGLCPEGTLNAVAGNYILRPDQPLQLAKDKPYARTVAALDEAGTTLWLILVDGKQPYYSEGARISEVEQLIKALGASVALKLDGGGSATMAMATPSGAKVLNATIHGKWPMNERPIATHLGFYTQPKAVPKLSNVP